MGLFRKSTREVSKDAFGGNRKRPIKGKKPVPRSKRPRIVLAMGRVRGALRGFLKLCLALGVTAVVILAGTAAYRHATTSDYFAFRTVEITGEKRLSEEEILKTARLSMGQNIFSVDMARAERMLLSDPWVVEAEVTRRLPGSLLVRVAERRARIMVNFDVLYLVDESGRVFKRWKQGDPIPSPVITGVPREQFIENSNAVEDILREAIDLADRYRTSGLEKIATLAEIHREVDGGFSFTVGEDPTYVRFGKGPYRDKLTRLATLFARITADGNRPEVIFFDNDIRPDRITVKLKKDRDSAATTTHENSAGEMKKRVSKI